MAVIILNNDCKVSPSVIPGYYPINTVLEIVHKVKGGTEAKEASVNQHLYDYWDERIRKWSIQ